MANSMLTVIGDVHGNFGAWHHLKRDAVPSIQIGDFGIGFGHEHIATRLHRDGLDSFFNGNHDNPDVCWQIPGFLGSYGSSANMFWSAGGYSVDWQWRTPGISWWANEEMSASQMRDCIQAYTIAKPDIVLSHEAPDFLGPLMLAAGGGLPGLPYSPSRTSLHLQDMLEIHKPKIWLYGHWHMNFEHMTEDTIFICVNANQAIDIDTETLTVGPRRGVRI